MPSFIFNDFVVKNFWTPLILFNFIESNKNDCSNDASKSFEDVTQYSLKLVLSNNP